MMVFFTLLMVLSASFVAEGFHDVTNFIKNYANLLDYNWNYRNSVAGHGDTVANGKRYAFIDGGEAGVYTNYPGVFGDLGTRDACSHFCKFGNSDFQSMFEQGSDKTLSCFMGCAADRATDRAGNDLVSCNDYCVEDRFLMDKIVSDESGNNLENMHVIPYMSDVLAYMGTDTDSGNDFFVGFFSNVVGSSEISFDKRSCIAGCNQRGVLPTLPPTDAPTDAPTEAPTTTDAPTDAPTEVDEDDSEAEFNGAEQTVQNMTIITGVVCVFVSFFTRT